MAISCLLLSVLSHGRTREASATEGRCRADDVSVRSCPISGGSATAVSHSWSGCCSSACAEERLRFSSRRSSSRIDAATASAMNVTLETAQQIAEALESEIAALFSTAAPQ